MSPEVNKYLAQKDQGFVAHEPQSQHAGARSKRLPVRVSDTRCPPTMPFPADPGKDSRLIGRAGMELVHAKDGNSPLVMLRPLNLRGWNDRVVSPCRPKDSKNRLSSDRITSRDCHIQFLAVDDRRLVASEECGILFIASWLYSVAGNCQAPAARRRSCAHRCHRELAILRLARLR